MSELSNQCGTRYAAEIVEDPYRTKAIAEFVRDLYDKDSSAPGIVFVRHKRHADLLAEAISAKLGLRVPAINSNVKQETRTRYAKDLQAGRLFVAVCTDVWATGIDIPNIRWVLMAGAGKAPIGLKQRVGRATRLSDAKPEYVVYDWQDLLPGNPAYAEQARTREEHYDTAGFSVRGKPPSSDFTPLEDPSVDGTRVAELLEYHPLPPGDTERNAVGRRAVLVTDNTWDTASVLWLIVIILACVMAATAGIWPS